MSILHREVPEPPVRLTHRTGLALVRAIRRTTGADARLKWPNDVLLADDHLWIVAERDEFEDYNAGLRFSLDLR